MKRTIIFKLGALGDLLLATPAVRAYKESFSKSNVTFIIGKSNRSVVANNVYIDNLISIDDKKILRGSFINKLSEAYRLIKIIRSLKADEIFILHRDWRYNFLSYLARVPKRYGFRRDMKGLFLTDSVETSIKQHEIEKYVNLFSIKKGFKDDGINMDLFPAQEDHKLIDDLFAHININDVPVVAIAPGGATNVKEEMDMRRWPLEYYIKLIDYLLLNNFVVILIGGPSDLRFTSNICKIFQRYNEKRLFDMAGKFSIQATYLLLKKCDLLVTNDCGPMHIGACANIPVVSIFGPTYPVEKAPITNGKSFYFWSGEKFECSPCYRDGKFHECQKKYCMYDISPEAVFKKIKEIVGSRELE